MIDRVSLYRLTAEFLKSSYLSLSLCAFGKSNESKFLCQSDDVAYYDNIVLLLFLNAELIYKALIDLQRIKRHLGKKRQRRITRSEVIH